MGSLGVLLLAVTLALTFSSPNRTTASGTATVSIFPASQTISGGGAFDVTIRQNASVATSGVQADLTFDRTKFQVTGIDLGSGYPPQIFPDPNPQAFAGEAVPAGAPSFPAGLGASETDCAAGESLPLDDDGDGKVNDGCPNAGAAESLLTVASTTVVPSTDRPRHSNVPS
jgi:hypothetical protein